MSIRKRKFFEARYFGFVIGVMVFMMFMVIKGFSFFTYLDMVVLDANFNLRTLVSPSSIQVGVSQQQRNLGISPDLLIVGVDARSLERFGKWPWPRYRHADFLNSLARIRNQDERESSVLLDFFFTEKSPQPEQDALFSQSISGNGRVVLESVLNNIMDNPSVSDDYYARQKALYQSQPALTGIKGDTRDMVPYLGVIPPLKPIALAGAGFGHPNFKPDADQTFRRQELVARFSELVEVLELGNIGPQTQLDADKFERLSWLDKDGLEHPVDFPISPDSYDRLTDEMGRLAPPVLLDDNSDGTPDRQFYVVQRYRDYYLPSLTLTLALRYFNRSPSEIEVVIGEHITIPQPQKFNTETGAWEAYRIETKQAVFNDSGEMLQAPEYREVPEIRIPIDRHGSMLINFMGPSSGDALSSYQTFPVRSYSGYASRATGPDKKTWPATMALGNKIILAGIFSPGTATDEKKTPFGIMYGIEIHANALNTILMDRFIQPLSEVQSALILLLVCLLVAFYAGRLKTPLALALTLVSIIAFTLSVTILFDFMSILIDFAVPSMAMLFTLIAIIVYRIMTEEKEKQRIQSMFGKYVSKTVVDQMVEAGEQPELGGVDKELTVLFSDIRGFTTLSESMTPQELVNHLNAYLTAMTDIIMEYQGTLDKYVGDEVMCFWGAPVAQADHAILACRCALRQMEKLAELNAAWPPERRIDIGIGLNSGIMTVGNMGSIGRMNYTLMGDNVNLGARLEGTNKQYYTHIIISEYTYGLVKDKVIVRELDNIRVKGKNKPVLIYELIDVID